ncbi:MAG: hypothetical protein JW984_10420 [Deltaproteobacteria bacterium]|uniref:Uncharacterized protein n=1 Tax=Candidatus Zymogenus saltonus TaxID=2844893 RepID=A0A9D8KG79_9DELT|nr:hypothetical protein [Candidatus Zymogenus saltonus]
MKKTSVIFGALAVLIFLYSSSAGAIQWDDGRLTVDYSIEVYHEQVYGNVTRSSLDVHKKDKDNWQYNEEFRLKLDQNISDNLNLDFFFYGRHTTDKELTNWRWKLLQAYLRLYGDDYEFAVGDISEYYSKYTFRNTFLGAKAWYRPVPEFRIMALGGRNRESELDTFEHSFGSVRLEFAPLPDYSLGATWIHTEITKLCGETYVTDYSNDVWALDTELRFLKRKLLIRGEGALSYYEEDRNNPLTDEVQGWAVWARADYRPIRKLKLSFEYERVDPMFYTVMGTASPDRESFKGMINYNPSPEWKFWGKYRHYRNALLSKSDVDFRTNTYYSELGATYRPFYDDDIYFKYLKLDLELDHTHRMSEDHPKFPKTTDYETYRLKLMASNRYKNMYYSLEYRLRYLDDHRPDEADTVNNTIRANWRYNFNALNLGWALGLGAGFDLKRTLEKVPTPKTYFDTTTILHAGLGVNYEPTKTNLKAYYDASFTNREQGDDTRRNVTEVAIEQVLYENEIFKSIVGASYKNVDYWSHDYTERYGENIYMFNFSLHF